MVDFNEADRARVLKAQHELDNLRGRTEKRMHEVAAKLLEVDQAWHDRMRVLQARHELEYNINNDVVLRQLGSTTKVLSDMLAGMAAYLTATRPKFDTPKGLK